MLFFLIILFLPETDHCLDALYDAYRWSPSNSNPAPGPLWNRCLSCPTFVLAGLVRGLPNGARRVHDDQLS